MCSVEGRIEILMGGTKLWFDQKSLFDPKHFFVNVPGDSLGPDPGTLPKLQAIKKQYL